MWEGLTMNKTKGSELEERIVCDPAVMVGKPVVRGTRIPVYKVLEYLSNNPNFEEIFLDYPRLTIDDVKACLRYARNVVDEESPGRRRGRRPTPSRV
jgi:uncharacterized protein (DUF433 family)